MASRFACTEHVEALQGHGLKLGRCLRELRDWRLYRCTAKSFEQYLAERWAGKKLTLARAKQYIVMANVADKVATRVAGGGQLPEPTTVLNGAADYHLTMLISACPSGNGGACG